MGIFDFFLKPKAKESASPKPVEQPKPQTAPTPAEATARQTSPAHNRQTPAAPVKEKPKAVKKMGIYPRMKDGQPLRYAYRFPFTAVKGIDVINDILGDCEKEVSVSFDNGRIALSHHDIVFGYIENDEKATMVADWERKDLPCNAILLASGTDVNLRFYKDKRIGQEWREQSVCKITGCKSERKQDEISCMMIGEEVDLDEDYNHDDAVIVSHMGEDIGKLPKKAAIKFLNEGAYGAFVEKFEEDDDFRKIPHIRIYW